MPRWKKVFFAVSALLFSVVAGSWLLPRQAVVERSIGIERPPAEVYAVLNSFERFNEWSPWFAADPAAAYTHSGPNSGVGARHAWKGNEAVGEGSQTITASIADRQIDIALAFGDNPPALSRYTLQPEGSGTRLSWRFEIDLGMNPVMRWFGLMFDRMIGADYERGLQQLKRLLEQPGTPEAASVATPATPD
ncbi:MAG: SRPBCC family protein [Xanthomonadales bacterium]|jgi:hypothetical protein|nr:SRPBCC family protein [Xanthomonadales bacterium]